MWFTSLFSNANTASPARRPARRTRRTSRKRPPTRRAAIARLEERTVLSGVVLTSVSSTSWDVADGSFLEPGATAADDRIMVAGTTANRASGEQNMAVVRYRSDGTLDPTFGTGGIVTTAFKNQSSAFSAAAYPPTQIVVAGYANGVHEGGYLSPDFALARYNADGSLDTRFGTKSSPGKVTTDVGGGSEMAHAALVQQDGNIVLAGRTSFGGALVRYTVAGKLDSTFGAGGIVISSLNGLFSYMDVTLHQGKLLAAGNASGDVVLARYNANGTLDTTFGQDLNADGLPDGMAIADFPAGVEVDSLAVAGNGSIIVLGNAYDDQGLCRFGLVRFLADGTVDTAFGAGGLAATNFGTRGPEPHALAIEAGTGKILAAGNTDDAGGVNFLIARFNPDGSLDDGGPGDATPGDSFGTAGATRTPILNFAQANSMVIQSDGKIVLSGFAEDLAANRRYIALARYNPDGSLDSTFGPAVPSLWITDQRFYEGNSGTTAYNFTVMLSSLSDVPVSVEYATANGTATAGSDYQATTGTLTIPAGSMIATITVLVNGDTTKEADETFYVNLSNPEGATIGDGQGIGTIRNDDAKSRGAGSSAASQSDSLPTSSVTSWQSTQPARPTFAGQADAVFAQLALDYPAPRASQTPLVLSTVKSKARATADMALWEILQSDWLLAPWDN